MIRAVLFDLDGTLSFMNQDEFMRNYVGLLTPRFTHLMSPDRFAKQLMRSTEVMRSQPQPGKTNMQTFFDDFCRATGLKFSVLFPILEDFYQLDFPALSCIVKPNPAGKATVELAKKQGYLVAVAANPVMPYAAIAERIRWTGLMPAQFDLVPAMEDAHFCKPNVGFFSEIASCLKLDPRECLMVGNDVQEDMIAKEIGMKTFFCGEPPVEPVSDYAGSLTDLGHLLLQGNL